MEIKFIAHRGILPHCAVYIGQTNEDNQIWKTPDIGNYWVESRFGDGWYEYDKKDLPGWLVAAIRRINNGRTV